MMDSEKLLIPEPPQHPENTQPIKPLAQETQLLGQDTKPVDPYATLIHSEDPSFPRNLNTGSVTGEIINLGEKLKNASSEEEKQRIIRDSAKRVDRLKNLHKP
jgi:hypothetical protein